MADDRVVGGAPDWGLTEGRIEALFDAPCYVVDFLPERVPAGAPGRFFAVEELFLGGARGERLRRAFADILLKLYCYDDMLVLRGGSDEGVFDPPPETLADWAERPGGELTVVLARGETLIALGPGDTHMSVYDPDEALRERLGALARAEGLFFRPAARED